MTAAPRGSGEDLSGRPRDKRRPGAVKVSVEFMRGGVTRFCNRRGDSRVRFRSYPGMCHVTQFFAIHCVALVVRKKKNGHRRDIVDDVLRR